MKKRVLLLVVVLISLIGLIVLHFYFGVFTRYNYLTAKWDILKDRLRILQYGEPIYSDKETRIIAQKFGFTYDIVAGCTVGSPLANGINIYNSVMTRYLNDKLGSTWKENFDFQVDSLFRDNRIDTIRKTVMAMGQIRQLDHYLDSVSNGKRHLYIWVLPQDKKGPNVRVSEVMPDSTVRVYSYYQVNPYTLSVGRIQY